MTKSDGDTLSGEEGRRDEFYVLSPEKTSPFGDSFSIISSNAIAERITFHVSLPFRMSEVQCYL
jgi:hypothetical protein